MSAFVWGWLTSWVALAAMAVIGMVAHDFRYAHREHLGRVVACRDGRHEVFTPSGYPEWTVRLSVFLHGLRRRASGVGGLSAEGGQE